MKKIIPVDAVLVPDDAGKLFEGVIFDTYQWQVERFDGSLSTWEMVRRPDTTSTICVVGDKIIVLEEEQPHAGKKFSFGGGRVDPTDASILAAAKRETH